MRKERQEQGHRQSQYDEGFLAGCADIVETDAERGGNQSGQSRRTAGDVQIQRHIFENFAAAVGHDHQKRTAHPQRRRAERHPDQGGHDPRRQERRPERPMQLLGQKRRGIGAQAEKGGMAEGSLADIAGHEVQAERRDAVNQANQQNMLEIRGKQIFRPLHDRIDETDAKNDSRKQDGATPARQP